MSTNRLAISTSAHVTSWEDSAYSLVGEGLLTINIVPEPEEYAIAFGLFAIGFVFTRRYLQKKREKKE